MHYLFLTQFLITDADNHVDSLTDISEDRFKLNDDSEFPPVI